MITSMGTIQPQPPEQLSKPESFTVIIQGRMNSSRLPGKVLIDIAGQPMLVHVIERARQADLVKEVVVATTTDPSDDPIAALCAERGVGCFRGSLLDVLDRYYQTALAFHATGIVRLTGDCPMMDPQVINQAILAFQSPLPNQERPNAPTHFDFACTRLPPPWHRTFPIGLDVEICSFVALERAWKESFQVYHREHVMPFLYEESRSIHYGITVGKNQSLVPRLLMHQPPEEASPFNVLVIDHDPDHGEHRWTVDTPEDLETIRQIFSRLNNHHQYSWYDVLEIIQNEPEITQINLQAKAKDYREVDQRSADLLRPS